MPNPNPNQSGIASHRFKELPPGQRNTRALRLSLSLEQADRWDALSKQERSSLVSWALEQKGWIYPNKE